MHYLAVACSYDETIASEGKIEEETSAALRRLVASGRHLILVTRRPLESLQRALPDDLFAWVVAEYGGLLYQPGTGDAVPLGPRLPHGLVDELRERGVEPLTVGEVTLSTSEENGAVLRQIIERDGLELRLVTDKDLALAVPPETDKATGLAAALEALELSRHNVLGIGDAETDRSFLEACELSVAVANAPDELKEACDVVTEKPAGTGVAEVIERLVAADLADVEPPPRQRVVLGHRDGDPVWIPSYGSNVLLAGASGAGKSRLVAGVLEHLVEQEMQCCVLDPEGDHAELEGAIHLGDRAGAPSVGDVLAALTRPDQSVVVNLLARRLDDLPDFLRELLRPLPELRTRTGRPHWLVLDEAHHFLPLPGHRGAFNLPRWLNGLVMATVNPDHVAPAALSLVNAVVTLGEDAGSKLARYCASLGERPPEMDSRELPAGHGLLWRRGHDDRARAVEALAGEIVRRPHLRRFAESELNDEKAFYFRGPDERLSLRASTLATFILLAEGVDGETWLHHLRRGEYSEWLRASVGDYELADQVAAVEADGGEPDETRRRIVAAIRDRYR